MIHVDLNLSYEDIIELRMNFEANIAEEKKKARNIRRDYYKRNILMSYEDFKLCCKFYNDGIFKSYIKFDSNGNLNLSERYNEAKKQYISKKIKGF